MLFGAQSVHFVLEGMTFACSQGLEIRMPDWCNTHAVWRTATAALHVVTIFASPTGLVFPLPNLLGSHAHLPLAVTLT